MDLIKFLGIVLDQIYFLIQLATAMNIFSVPYRLEKISQKNHWSLFYVLKETETREFYLVIFDFLLDLAGN